MSEKYNASRQSSGSMSRNNMDKSNFSVYEHLYLHKAPTQPRGPRLLTSILPLVREHTAAAGIRNTPRSRNLSDVSTHEEEIGAFPAPTVPRSRSVSPDVAALARTAEPKRSTRHSGSLGTSSKQQSIRSTSSRPQHTLHSPVQRDVISKSPFRAGDSHCTGHGLPGSIPAYHCTTAAFTDTFSEDHQGQWQWIRGNAKKQGQQFDSDSDECSSWYQSPFSATFSAYPSPSTPTVQPTAHSKNISDRGATFHTPVRSTSTRSKPLISSFRVPEHTGSYSASFSARKSRTELSKTAPPNMHRVQRGPDPLAVASRQLNFEPEVSAAHPAAQVQPEDEDRPINFVSVLQARHQAFQNQELDVDSSPLSDLVTKSRNGHLPLHTPPHSSSQAPFLCPQTIGGVPKGRLAAARERLRQNVRLQRARSEDIMMFHNPCAETRASSPLPPYPDVAPSPIVPLGRAYTTAPARSRSSPQPCTSPTDAQMSVEFSGSQPESLHPTPFTYMTPFQHSEDSQGAGTGLSEQWHLQCMSGPEYATLQLPVPPCPSHHQHTSHIHGECIHKGAVLDHDGDAALVQERGLTLYNSPEQGVRSAGSALPGGSVRLPIDYQLPPMKNSQGGSTAQPTGDTAGTPGDVQAGHSQVQAEKAPATAAVADVVAVVDVSLAAWEPSSAYGSACGVTTGTMQSSVRSQKARQELLELDEQLLIAQMSLQSNSSYKTCPDSLSAATCMPGMHDGVDQAEHLTLPAAGLSQQVPTVVNTVNDPTARIEPTTLATASSPLKSAPSELQADVPGPAARPLEYQIPCSSTGGQPSELMVDSCPRLPANNHPLPHSDRQGVSTCEGSISSSHPASDRPSSVGAAYTIVSTCDGVNVNAHSASNRSSSVGVNYSIVSTCESGNFSLHADSNQSSSVGATYTIVSTSDGVHAGYQPASNQPSSVGVDYSICTSTISSSGQEHIPQQIAGTDASETKPSAVSRSNQRESLSHSLSFVDHPPPPGISRTESAVEHKISELQLPQRASSPDRNPSSVFHRDIRLSPIGSRIFATAEQIMKQDRRIQATSIDTSVLHTSNTHGVSTGTAQVSGSSDTASSTTDKPCTDTQAVQQSTAPKDVHHIDGTPSPLCTPLVSFQQQPPIPPPPCSSTGASEALLATVPDASPAQVPLQLLVPAHSLDEQQVHESLQPTQAAHFEMIQQSAALELLCFCAVPDADFFLQASLPSSTARGDTLPPEYTAADKPMHGIAMDCSQGQHACSAGTRVTVGTAGEGCPPSVPEATGTFTAHIVTGQSAELPGVLSASQSEAGNRLATDCSNNGGAASHSNACSFFFAMPPSPLPSSPGPQTPNPCTHCMDQTATDLRDVSSRSFDQPCHTLPIPEHSSSQMASSTPPFNPRKPSEAAEHLEKQPSIGICNQAVLIVSSSAAAATASENVAEGVFHEAGNATENLDTVQDKDDNGHTGVQRRSFPGSVRRAGSLRDSTMHETDASDRQCLGPGPLQKSLSQWPTGMLDSGSQSGTFFSQSSTCSRSTSGAHSSRHGAAIHAQGQQNSTVNFSKNPSLTSGRSTSVEVQCQLSRNTGAGSNTEAVSRNSCEAGDASFSLSPSSSPVTQSAAVPSGDIPAACEMQGEPVLQDESTDCCGRTSGSAAETMNVKMDGGNEEDTCEAPDEEADLLDPISHVQTLLTFKNSRSRSQRRSASAGVSGAGGRSSFRARSTMIAHQGSYGGSIGPSFLDEYWEDTLPMHTGYKEEGCQTYRSDLGKGMGTRRFGRVAALFGRQQRIVTLESKKSESKERLRSNSVWERLASTVACGRK